MARYYDKHHARNEDNTDVLLGEIDYDLDDETFDRLFFSNKPKTRLKRARKASVRRQLEILQEEKELAQHLREYYDDE